MTGCQRTVELVWDFKALFYNLEMFFLHSISLYLTGGAITKAR